MSQAVVVISDSDGGYRYESHQHRAEIPGEPLWSCDVAERLAYIVDAAPTDDHHKVMEFYDAVVGFAQALTRNTGEDATK